MRTIGPEEAKTLLGGRHPDNRRISTSRVSFLVSEIASGRWKPEHQGILLGKNGVLIDGQHRLAAVAKCGIPISILVFRDETAEGPRGLPIDIGMARRGEFVLGMDRPVVEACGVCVLFLLNSSERNLAGIAAVAASDIGVKLKMIPLAKRRLVGTAAVRAAVAVACCNGADRAIDDYLDMVAEGYRPGMAPAIVQLQKRLLSNPSALGSGLRMKVATIAWIAFSDRSRRTLPKDPNKEQFREAVESCKGLDLSWLPRHQTDAARPPD
jgi:hypothetical protein